MHTPKKIESVYTPEPGDVVVLRGLRTNPHQDTSALIGPRIGLLERQFADGRWWVRLRIGRVFISRGSAKYSNRGRAVERACIERPATPREQTLGAVVDRIAERAA